MKKALCLILALAMLFCISSCKRNYPELEGADMDSMELTKASFGNITASYPSDTWEFSSNLNIFTIFYKDTMASDNAVNINLNTAGSASGALTERDMKDIIKGIEEQADSYEVTEAHMCAINGVPSIYSEMEVFFTDELLDMAIESGAITEDDISNAGGREAILDRSSTKNITIYSVVNKTVYV